MKKKSGVISTCTGKKAQVLARAGKEQGIPVTLVMPTKAQHANVEYCKKQGANVILAGDNFFTVRCVVV